ncbi:hypothetical protein [Nonomuraea sp. JJY05]|uniref:hypothetical protein n=1 Tax=Nonomuraea sp. JJY05 TaxID=3350255 RepID=UPI00373FAEC3
MSAASIGRRSWRSFIGGRAPVPPRPAGRGRAGYSLRQRFWASFIGLDLPPKPSVLLPNTSAPQAASRPGPAARLTSGWFALPPLLAAGGLTAAGGDAVVLEASSPDGRATFLVRRHGGERPDYRLELVLRGVDAARPLVSELRYTRADGGEQVLIVPVVRGRLGPPAALVRLPGFTAGTTSAGWAATTPALVTPSTTWESAAVAESVRAALNEATRDAWRRVRETAGEELREVIDGELP